MNKILTFLVIIFTIAVSSVSIISISEPDKTVYLASYEPTVCVYDRNSNDKFKSFNELPRGSAVKELRGTAEYDGKVLREIEYEKGGKSLRSYALEENIVDERNECVKEKVLYVRTPVTIYASKSSAEISSFAKKGSRLDITGFDKILSDGTINKYRIKSGNTEGFVYGKYLVSDKASSIKYYNENGELDKAKKDTYPIKLYGGNPAELDYYPNDKGNIKGKKFLEDARAVYLHAGALKKDSYYNFVTKSGANAVVINIDGGTLAYKSPIAKELCPTAYKNAHMSLEKYQKLVKRYNDAGIYTIGRIACFNDKNYAKDHPEDCIKTGGSQTSWVSAYSRNAWEYKVLMATEAVQLIGFDEIQFDYVRFPETAYNMSISGNTDFKNKYGESKAQAIQNFCFYASDQIHESGAYFSADVFGECSNGYVTAYGQYWPAISNVVDAISSMPYTDHFGSGDTWSNPYPVMLSWAKSAAEQQSHIPSPAVARTWITGYNTPYTNPTVSYGYDKLKEQVDALEDAGLTGGFIPWNSSCDLNKYKQYQKIWSK